MQEKSHARLANRHNTEADYNITYHMPKFPTRKFLIFNGLVMMTSH